MQVKNFEKQKEAVSSFIPMKPSLSLSSRDLPVVKKWKVGKEYVLELHVRQKGMHEDGKDISANFEILSAKECGAED